MQVGQTHHDCKTGNSKLWKSYFTLNFEYLAGNLGYILSTFWGEKNRTLTWAISLKNVADQSRFGFRQLIWSVYFSIPVMRTARSVISGNQLASTGKFECRNFSNFRLCQAIFSICSICSNIVSCKTIVEHARALLILKTATFSQCNSVFFGVKICTLEVRKSNILAPKHGGDGVILASVIWLIKAQCLAGAVNWAGVRGPYYSGQW